MELLSILISAVAAFLFYTNGHIELMILAILTTLGSLWSCVVLLKEAQTTPKWIKWINLVFTIIGIVLLFTGLAMKYK